MATIVQVDRETAEKFFEAGGWLHKIPSRKPPVWAVPTVSKEHYPKLPRGNWGIEEADPHPANPFRTGKMRLIRPI